MARKRGYPPRSGSVGVRILVAGLILLLILGATYGLFSYLHQSSAASPQINALPDSAAVPSGELISDDRIIFAGIPRAKNPPPPAPPGALTLEVLKNQAYIVGYSETRKDPLFSCYRVQKMEHPFILERPKGDFITDTRTRALVKHRDFSESGYDRGHMTPNSAIARCYGAEAQRETFLLSNICPQASKLNREVWEHLENEEFVYAAHAGEVWVMDGPIFADMNGGHTDTLKAGIAVPEAFYKILVEEHSPGGGGVRAFAVIMPQTVKGTELPKQFVRSIKEIEDETGLEFLWKLDPETRARLENAKSPMWDE